MKLYFEEITGDKEISFAIEVIDPQKKDISSMEFFWLVNGSLTELGFQITNTIKKGIWDFQIQAFSTDRKKKTTSPTFKVSLNKMPTFREDEEAVFLKANESLKKAKTRISQMEIHELLEKKKAMKLRLDKENLTQKDIEEIKILREVEEEIIKRKSDIENCLVKNKISNKDRETLFFMVGF